MEKVKSKLELSVRTGGALTERIWKDCVPLTASPLLSCREKERLTVPTKFGSGVKVATSASTEMVPVDVPWSLVALRLLATKEMRSPSGSLYPAVSVEREKE